jgi:two-component system, sensor histidine kinase and response regulator
VERQGHAVAVAGTGREALEALERERFDLVLMDLQMPDMDGLAAVKAIRDLEARASRGTWVPSASSSFSAGGRIPVVAVTAHAMRGDEERCLAAGMDGYVTKPIRPTELASAIERLLPRETLPLKPAVPPPVDLEVALRLAAGDEELRAEVAAMFVESSQRHQAELRDATQAADCVRIRQIAHALKGSAGAVGGDDGAGSRRRAGDAQSGWPLRPAGHGIPGRAALGEGSLTFAVTTEKVRPARRSPRARRPGERSVPRAS